MMVVTDIGKGETAVTVQTELRDRKITGFDTTILVMPTEFYVSVAGEPPGLALNQFSAWLNRLANQQASDLGERLHHAEFTITTSRATVETLGRMHDCDVCREGVRTAIRFMHEHPGAEMVVGQLYWAGP